MSLSKNALSLYKYLHMYKLTTAQLAGRRDNPNYNSSWVNGGIFDKGRRIPTQRRGSLFQSAINELAATYANGAYY